ncbi:hypothetical protein BgiMline_007525, partial [Biomphalaria glabrata]
QSHLSSPPPKYQSPVATGKHCRGRCGYTGSRSCNPADRRLRPFGRSPLTQSSSGVRQPPERLSSSI